MSSSSLSNAPRSRPRRVPLLACVAALLGTAAGPRTAAAQSAVEAGDVGYELTLAGRANAVRGAPLRLAGVAYEVQGLATLDATAGLELVVELMTRDATGADRIVQTATTRSEAGGRFELAVATPETELGPTWLNVRVRRPGRTGRTFTFSVSLTESRGLDVLSDRRRYEPGETVHAWVRALHGEARAPLANLPLTVQLLDGSRRPVASVEARTGASGAVARDLALPAASMPGSYVLEARAVDGALVAQTYLEVVQRTTERLALSVSLDEAVVVPGAALTGRVRVTTPSGSPVRNANVEVWIQSGRGDPLHLVTDADGVATIDTHAPSFVSGDRSSETLAVRVVHPAYGTLTTTAGYTVSRTRWQVEAHAENGALVPEVDQTIYLAVTDPRGQPIPAGQEVDLRGLGAPGGHVTGRTDARGLVPLTVRLPRGAAARMEGGACAGETPSTSFEVEVRTRPISTTTVCVPVAVDAEVALHAQSVVVPTGGVVNVEVTRRGSANGRPILLELVRDGVVFAFGWVEGSRRDGQLTIPADLPGGVWSVRGRPVSADDARGPLDGAGTTAVRPGASVSVLVRPADAFAVSVAPERELFHVRDQAGVVLEAHPATPGTPVSGWAALVVRDEAQNGGEPPWIRDYLAGELRDALQSPTSAAEDRFLRATLAASTALDAMPMPPPPIDVRPWEQERWSYGAWGQTSGLLRDPIGTREELYRRQLGPLMQMVEQAVAEIGADQEARARLLRVNGRRVELAGDFFTQLAGAGSEPQTLGGQPMTVTMLTQADPSFTFDSIARRIARQRLVELLVALAAFSNPADLAAQRASASEPPERWLSRLVQLGVLDPSALVDPWGRSFELRRVSGRRPAVVVSERALGYELSSPGPDGVPGNGDDVRDPFLRAIPRGTIYALASGEDTLMDMLSSIAPGEHVLGEMARAYQALSLAASEEQTATAVTSGSTEMADMPMAMPMADDSLGGLAEGAYGGGLYSRTQAMDGDYAAQPAPPPSPAAARRAMAPAGSAAAAAPVEALEMDRLRSEATAEQAQGPLDATAVLLREEFPATLHFVGEVALDGSGRARLDVPLLDALTTYRLETIAWSPSGWITSGHGELRVDQDAMVDAPVPEAVAVGDVLRIPVRVQNRTGASLVARVEVRAEGELGLAIGESVRVEVGPHDAEQAVVEVRATGLGHGALVIEARREDGTALDAVRRPVTAFEDARLVRDRRLDLVESGDALAFEIPDGATPRGPGQVRLSVAGAMFGEPTEWSNSDPSWTAWTLAMGHASMPSELVERLVVEARRQPELGELTYYYRSTDAERVARIVGALWGDARLADDDVRGVLRYLAGIEPEVPTRYAGYQPPLAVRDPIATLFALAPAMRSDARPALRATLTEAVARLATEAANLGARQSDDPVGSAWTAAALALSGLSEETGRAREMLRRAERDVVVVGDQAWLESASDGSIEPRLEPSAVLALAYQALGEPRRALPFLRTLARAARGAPHWTPRGRSLASGAAAGLTRSAPSEGASLTFDGVALPTRVEHGVLVAELPELTRPGHHVLGTTLAPGVLALAQVELRYGVAWDRAPARPAPIDLGWDGELGARETRSAMRLVVRNRGTRVLVRPVVEVQLPAGAELDEPTREALAVHLVAPAAVEGSTLRLELRPIAPGGTVRLPIPARWSVGGALHGQGVSAWDDAQPSSGDALSVAVLASHTLTIADAGAEPARSETELSAPPAPPPPLPVPLPRPLSLAEGLR